MRRALAALTIAGLVLSGRALRAQDSQFGIPGLGTPGRFESVRARATGGAFALFDATSTLGEAALVDVASITASAATATSYRSLSGVNGTLREARFPGVVLAGPLGGGWVLSGGFSTYLDRSYLLRTHDTVTIRGVDEPVTDDRKSDGAVSDGRVALALRASPRIALGAAFHLLTGSTRETVLRTFADSSLYRAVQQSGVVKYDGLGASASALVDLTPRLRLAGVFRSDTRLRASVGAIETARNDLPVTVGGALGWSPAAGARLAGAVTWRSWSDAGAHAHNTTSWSAGAELGGGGGTWPLRVGVRGGGMPFGPDSSLVTEFGFAAGTGRSFAEGHGRLDATLEHVTRSGAGTRESVWTFLMGLTVRP